MKAIIDYEPLSPEKRLEDVSQTAEGWKFETLEHDEMNFPHVIRATDAEGRSCLYVAFGPEGGAIDIKRWSSKHEDAADSPRRSNRQAGRMDAFYRGGAFHGLPCVRAEFDMRDLGPALQHWHEGPSSWFWATKHLRIYRGRRGLRCSLATSREHQPQQIVGESDRNGNRQRKSRDRDARQDKLIRTSKATILYHHQAG